MSFKLSEIDKQKVDPVSVTVPHEALTIQEIFRRTQLGLPVGVFEKKPIYNLDDRSTDFDTEDLSKVADLDLTEKHELLDQARQKVKDSTDKVKKEKEEAALKKKKAADEYQAIRDRYLKDQTSQGANKDVGSTKGKEPAD